MKNTITAILGTVVAAGIIANVAFIFQVNARLARIETKMEMFERGQSLSRK